DCGHSVDVESPVRTAPNCVRKAQFTSNWPSKALIFCKIGFNCAQMPDISSGILSLFCLFSYTFRLRRLYFLFSGPLHGQILTFCWFKVWRNRHEGWKPEASRCMRAVLLRRPRTSLSSIHTNLAFVKSRVRLHRLASNSGSGRGIDGPVVPDLSASDGYEPPGDGFPLLK